MEYYQIPIIYKSGADFIFAIEVNRPNSRALEVSSQWKINETMWFDGQRIFPVRINYIKIFRTNEPIPQTAEDHKRMYPDGYRGTFGGIDVTSEFGIITEPIRARAPATGVERAREKKLLFFSYSSKDSIKVGELCDILVREYDYEIFRAHDTIKVTQEWRAEIKENLANCDGLVAYITRNFRGSEWTYQECGWVAGRGVPIYSLFIMKKIPEGFIEERQGTRITEKTDVKEIARKIDEVFSEEI